MPGTRRAKYFPRVPQGSLSTGTANVTGLESTILQQLEKLQFGGKFWERHYELYQYF